MLVYILSFFIGSCFGSFFTLVSERLPIGYSLMSPRSRCNYCLHPLSLRDLVPVASYLFLRGRCRHCQYSYPATSFAAEIVTGCLFCLLTFGNFWHITFLPGLLLLTTALLLSLTDYLHLLVEPLIFYPLSAVTAGVILFLPSPFTLHLVDSVICFLVLSALAKGFPNHLGGGDVLLLTSWALFLGGYGLNLILLFGSLFALIFAVLKGLHRKQRIPFVPFLSLAMAFYLFWQFAIYM